jgi:hypothetical protein
MQNVWWFSACHTALHFTWKQTGDNDISSPLADRSTLCNHRQVLIEAMTESYTVFFFSE